MSTQKTWLVLGLGLVLLALLIGAAVVYSPLLGTRLAPGLRFRVLGPTTLIVGEPAVVTWDTSPENRRRTPTEKIEFCRGRGFGEACVTLAPDTPNDGEALVYVPSGLKPGQGYLRLTARAPGTRLLPTLSAAHPVTVQIATRLQPGQGVTLAWKANRAYPQAKIDFCVPRRPSGETCTTLANSVPNTGRAQVTVPANFSVAVRGIIRVRARARDGTLVSIQTPSGSRLLEQPAVLVRVARRIAGGPSSGDGGESGGGGSGGGDDSGSAPAPEQPTEPRTTARFLSPEEGHRVQSDDPFIVTQVLLSWMRSDSSTEPACQQWKVDDRLLTRDDWSNGESPDLSEEPCL
jgi:hypothetical protein